MLIWRGWLVVFNGLNYFLLGCGPSPWLLIIFLWYFYFEKGHSKKTSIFVLLASRPPPIREYWLCGSLVVLPLPWVCLSLLPGASLVLPGLHSIRFFIWFTRGYTQFPLGVLGSSFFAGPWCSSLHLLDEFRAPYGELVLLPPSWGYTIRRGILVPMCTAWSGPTFCYRVCLLTLFVSLKF